jgi:hypothetical protein
MGASSRNRHRARGTTAAHRPAGSFPEGFRTTAPVRDESSSGPSSETLYGTSFDVTPSALVGLPQLLAGRLTTGSLCLSFERSEGGPCSGHAGQDLPWAAVCQSFPVLLRYLPMSSDGRSNLESLYCWAHFGPRFSQNRQTDTDTDGEQRCPDNRQTGETIARQHKRKTPQHAAEKLADVKKRAF